MPVRFIARRLLLPFKNAVALYVYHLQPSNMLTPPLQQRSSSNSTGLAHFIRRPFLSPDWLRAEQEVEQYGLTRKSHIIRVAKVVLFVLLCALLVGLVVYLFKLEEVSWVQAFSAMLSLGIAIVAYQQWLAARYEISTEKYYDRLDSANKRLEGIEGTKKEDMHAFVELDKLEYVIIKYNLGYISPDLALRALNNFRRLCDHRPGFKELALRWVKTAAYLDRTEKVVEAICASFLVQQPENKNAVASVS